jgi:glycolate oxidase FAD binding subunit
MALGNVPRRYDLALRTAKLDRVVEYEPADLTVTVEAGMTAGRLETLLGEHGQFLPIDAPLEATAGGALAAGLSGPSSHAYGLPRDWLIGCRVAHADGTISKGGGRVVKNVAGYDLPKLAVGALGTLGVIVEATFKVAPLPARQETLLFDCASVEEASTLTFAADERGLALRAVALLPQAQEGATTAFWLAGPLSAVERTARELRELAGADARRLEAGEADRWWDALGATGGGVTLRASLTPSAVLAFMQRLRDAAPETQVHCLAYPTTGIVLAALQAEPDRAVAAIEAARRAAAEAGGTLVVTSAPLDVKRRIDVWDDPGSALPLKRRFKEQFDPHGTLNPGRFVGGL